MQNLRNNKKLDSIQLGCFLIPRANEELYNIQQDPFELNNLAKNPEFISTLKTLRETMVHVRKTTNDSLPSKRTPDEFDRETGQPNNFRIRPRPSKSEMWKVYENTGR